MNKGGLVMNMEKIEQETHQKIRYYKKINSTHLHAKKIEKEGDQILIAEIQTAGIGTKGREWHTGENKNIAMTIIKHPKCQIKELEGLTTKIAEKIQQTIEKMYGYKLKIKIPNDLILNGKKMCGILTEVHTQGENIEYLLISIGFNVNEEKFSDELKDIATSLKVEYQKEFCREDIIINIIKSLNEL
mgnify:FL=1